MLQEFDVSKYETITNLPEHVVTDIFNRARKGKVVTPEDVQHVKDFFQEILVGGKIEEGIMAKALRYVLSVPKLC